MAALAGVDVWVVGGNLPVVSCEYGSRGTGWVGG